MLVALLALFVALGGSSYAAVKIGAKDLRTGAVGSRAIADNSIRATDIRNGQVTGRDVKDGSITRADVDATGLRAATAGSADTATSATSAGTAISARTADSARIAGSATSAGDADRLDGLDSAEFTRRSCESRTGALRGSVTVAASAGFSSAFTAIAGFNCSGGSIEARRLSMGRYELRFNGSPATQAVATAIVSGIKADMVSVANSGPGQFTVFVLDPLPAPGSFVDDPFTVITP
jgi:hypothetical protein